MFELIAFGAALIGGFAAGLWDLKTSDIPDEIPALMVALGLFIWYASGLTTGNWMPFLASAGIGTLVFALGWGLYKLGQWGGGDAALLAGIFYLIPGMGFLTDYVFNFFIVALLYSVVYSFGLGFVHPEVFGYTADVIRKTRIWTLLVVWFIFGAIMVGALSLTGLEVDAGMVIWPWLGVFALILFYVYAKVVEKKVFRRSVSIDKLKVGDVIADSRRWEGVSEEKIYELRRKHIRTVDIKEGVRFGLVFPLTLVVTMLFGNVLFWLFGLV